MEDTIKGFTLPNKTVVVKYIKRKKGMASNVGEDHVISGGMLSGAVKKFQLPLLKNGSLANILTNDEKKFLENETGLNLSVYGDFWYDHFVSLYKDDNLLDLRNPIDYISYKILLCLKDDVAPSWKDRDKKQTYQFVITSEDEEVIEQNNKFDNKEEAFKLYGKIKDNKEKLTAILSLLTNKPISEDSTLGWVQRQVGEFLDSKPKAFLDLVKDDSLDTKLLIQFGVDNKIITRKGNKYSTIDGLDLCEGGQSPSFDNAVKYLDNPKHQDVRSLIEAKLSKSK
jgi:hypothetical protein